MENTPTDSFGKRPKEKQSPSCARCIGGFPQQVQVKLLGQVLSVVFHSEEEI